ncbi:MAG: hypothetical protein JW776_11215 [Candidatus Lokiarchaeota archaeon]|nr:hypothetical protein [Candidatus Lokiarchaeota archaeon]
MAEEKPNKIETEEKKENSEELENDDDLLSLEEEEEEQLKDYKHLKARLMDQKKDTYRIEFIAASHGFLNYLTNILLTENEVEYAAYKKTTLGNPIMTIITDGSTPIKKILQNACKKIDDELKAIQNAFKAEF